MLGNEKWHRKKLVYGDDKSVVDAVITIAKDSKNPLGQIQALWTLEGMGKLSADLLTTIKTSDAAVASQVILLAKTMINSANEAALLPIFETVVALDNFDQHLQVAHSLGKVTNPEKDELWMDLATIHANNPIMAEALVSSIAGKETQLLPIIEKLQKESALVSVLNKTIDNIANDNRKELVLSVGDQTDDRTRGFELYQTYCGTCHGMDGKGMENLAPPL